MLYNRLITRARRVEHFVSTLEAWDESHCSGRSTAIILAAISEAIQNPQMWIAMKDHYPAATEAHLSRMVRVAVNYAEKLNLRFFEAQGSRIRSCHMTHDQLELK